jgi:formylglycine-generating enzyme required for sulfatase activity
MTRAELEQAIMAPARGVALSFADGLVPRILDDVGDEPGHLPLLEFVLKRLWEDRQGPELSHQAYDAMGGLQGAVAQKAEEVFGTLSSAEQDSLKRIFLHVVRAGETGEDTRRRATRSEIGAAAMHVAQKLADERLLVTNRVGAEEETVEVSHEALIRQWQRVQTWLNEDREFLLWRDRLRVRVSERQHNPQDDGTLLHGAPLVEAERWLSHKGDLLTDQEQDYIRDSAAAHAGAVQAERQRVEHEIAQANRLAEEAAKREEAERARAEAADRARRRQQVFSLALLILLLAGLIEAWLWQMGYNLPQAALKVKSVFVSIHVLPEMVPVPAGTFQMGDVEKLGDSWRNPVHPVTIKPFSMGQYEVTFDEYDAFAIATGRRLPEDQGWGRGKRPVINVSWDEAKAYAAWLSKESGKRYRLPTESEWEYAARSGAKEVWAGTSEQSKLGDYAVFLNNSGNRTAEVGTKQANGFELHDLTGNVWEWVEDCVHGTYEGAPQEGSAWLEQNEGECGRRVLRGGSWGNTPVDLRVSNRNGYGADSRNSLIGFRLAQDREP